MATKIHGIRVYVASTKIVQGVDAPICIHDDVCGEHSDLFYIFRLLAPAFRGHFVADDFLLSYGQDGQLVDPLPRLRELYGPSLLDADISSQIMLLDGDGFEQWSEWMRNDGWAFLPVFQDRPSYAVLRQVFWGHPRLDSESWPANMRALLHLRDGVYWQCFSIDRADIDVLVRAHAGDPKLDIYYVDFDCEYPDPSGQELQPATFGTDSV